MEFLNPTNIEQQNHLEVDFKWSGHMLQDFAKITQKWRKNVFLPVKVDLRNKEIN
jgi:hypothetical protein